MIGIGYAVAVNSMAFMVQNSDEVDRFSRLVWEHRRKAGKTAGIDLPLWDDETPALRDEVRAEVRMILGSISRAS